jgi:hypothetical protein
MIPSFVTVSFTSLNLLGSVSAGATTAIYWGSGFMITSGRATVKKNDEKNVNLTGT